MKNLSSSLPRTYRFTLLSLTLLSFLATNSVVNAKLFNPADLIPGIGGGKGKPPVKGDKPPVKGGPDNGRPDTSKPEVKNALHYGKTIWIQNGGYYRRFLIGMRGGKDDNPETRDPWEYSSEVEYKWELLRPNTRGGSAGGGCVKFGDRVLIKMTKEGARRPYMYLRDDGKRDDARNGGWNDDVDEQRKYQWVIRSNPGETGDPTKTNDDPAKGMCVVDMSRVFIQSYLTNDRWMKGGFEKDEKSANLRDIYDGDEADAGLHFQWILRKEKGLGHLDDGISCLPTASTGVWNYLATATGGDYTLTYTEGVTRSTDRSHEQTKTWDTSVSASVEANFAFGSASTEVTQSFGGSMSTTVSNSLSRNEDVSHATTWYEKGVIWQYAIHMADLCVPGWDVTTNEVFMTPGIDQPPCCLPGYFLDINNPHGPCKAGTPCQCSPDVCEGNDEDEEDEDSSTEEQDDTEDDKDSSYEDEDEDEEDSYEEPIPKKGGPKKPKKPKQPKKPTYDDDYYYDDDNNNNRYDDDYGYYDDDRYYDDDYGYYYDDDDRNYGGSGGKHGLNYDGDGPLISLNINQANNNNNGGGFTPNNNYNSNNGGAPPPPGYGGNGGYNDYNNGGYGYGYEYPNNNDGGYMPDNDYDYDADAIKTDDFMDIVLDAVKWAGKDRGSSSSSDSSSEDDMDLIRRRTKLRGSS